MAIIHLGFRLPEKLERPTRKRLLQQLITENRAGNPFAFSYLVLHHGEFTWPGVDVSVSSVENGSVNAAVTASVRWRLQPAGYKEE